MAVFCPGKQGEREIKKGKGERVQRISQILRCCIGPAVLEGLELGSWERKWKRRKSVRGPDLFSFIDNLAQASCINQIFCPVLLMCAQPAALGALPQEVSGDRDTEHKCPGEAGSWLRTVLPHLYIFRSHLAYCSSHNVWDKKCLCLVLHRWQKQINKIGWLEEQIVCWRLEAGWKKSEKWGQFLYLATPFTIIVIHFELCLPFT